MRAALTQEMHVRRFPPLSIPSHVLQIVAFLGDRREAAERHLAALRGCEAPAPGARYHRCQVGEVELVWERHTEFCTYTLLAEGRTTPLFSQELFATVDGAWLQSIPGEIIRASHVVLLHLENSEASEEALMSGFAEDSLVCCDLAGGAARMYSDFKLHGEGNGRLLIVDRGLVGIERGQLLRRLLELGNYRKMALLGLPVAQAGMAELEQLEMRLADLTTAVASAESEPASLLDELTGLSAEIARLSAETRFRMGASDAYGRLVDERLSALRVEPVRGYLSLADFTERRLHPALRTCASFSSRLSDLAGRAEWTSALMRTRVETALTAQNRDLLASMDRRASIQLRLQETVEGLSVVAISYYAVGLLNYAEKPFLETAGISSGWFTAAAVVLALGGTWSMLRLFRRRWKVSGTRHPRDGSST